MSSSAAIAPSTEPPRRRLTSRQAATVANLTQAAVEELRKVGFEALTVRNVAKRAGVAPATAYTYFTSREHLVTEVFWRRLQALPETRIDARRTPAHRLTATLTDFALLVADEPELSNACSAAMLASDPDVKLLRDRIGAEMRRRVALALGDDVGPEALRTLDFAISGALLHAGMGHVRYADLPGQLADVVAVVLGDGGRP